MKKTSWKSLMVVGVVLAAVMIAGFWTSGLFAVHHAKAQSASPASTVVFGLSVYGNQLMVTGTTYTGYGGPFDLWSYPGSGIAHGIYLNASSFSVDFRVGLEICQRDGTACHTGWTPWAYDAANNPAGNNFSPIVGGGPYTGGTVCGVPAATLHNRLGDVFIMAQTRPLPPGTILNNVTLSLYPVEYDYNVPVDGQLNSPCTPVSGQTPGITPSGGGWSNGAYDKWNNASTDGFSIEISASSYSLDAAPVSNNIPTSFSAGQTKTIGTDGKPLQVVMKNTGSGSGGVWSLSFNIKDTGTPQGTCGYNYSGSGNDAPPVGSPDGSSCSVAATLTATNFGLVHTGAFSTQQQIPITYNVTKTTTYHASQQQTQTGQCNWVSYIGRGFCSLDGSSCSGTTCYSTISTGPSWTVSYTGGGYSPYIASGQSVAFSISSLAAPSQAALYNESWQMEKNGTPFGSPLTIPITVGPSQSAASGTISVASTNIVTGGPVAGSWSVFGPVTVNSANKTVDTYTGLPNGSYNVIPGSASGFALGTINGMHIAAAHEGNPFLAMLARFGNPFSSVAFAASGQQVSATVCDTSNPSSYSFNSSLGLYGCQGGSSGSQTLSTSSEVASSTIGWYPIANMTVAPTSVTLSTTGSGQFTVQNSGSPGSALYWTASTTSSWFTLSPASGSLVNAANQSGTSGASQAVAIVPSSTLAPGTYTGTVNVMGTSLYCDATSHAGCNLQPFSVSVSFTKPVPPLVKSVSETITPDQVAPGGSAQALGTVTYSDGSTDNNVTYSSDNTGVATVDPHTGAIQAKALGTANIEAISNASSSHFATAAILVVNGGGCSGNCSGGNPTVSVTAIPTTISQAETATCHATVTGTASTTVIWSAKNGAIKGSGSTVTLAPSTAPTATCIATLAADSAASGSATVTVVNTTNPLNAPTCSLSANPTSVLIPQATTISYSCKHVSSCTLSGGSFGSQSTVAVNGSTETAVGTTQDSPTQNTVYTITCYGTNNYSTATANDSVTVTVSNPGRSETNP